MHSKTVAATDTQAATSSDQIQAPGTRPVPPGFRRVNVNFSTDTYETLASLATRKSTNMSEILRQAISLTKFVEDIIANGGRVLVDRGGTINELLIR